MTQLTKDECLMALAKAYQKKDEESYHLVWKVILEHFSMLEHMRETSLYDVFEYEKRLAGPLEIFAYENARLKKEVNQLRRELGKIEKYKEN